MDLLAGLEASALGEWARTARWGYAAVNASHIFAVALILGAMVPLNAVRLGLPGDRIAASRLLTPFAVGGLLLAMLTGAVLFSARATEYAALGVFRAKLALIAVGVLAALILVGRYGMHMARASHPRQALHAAHSVATWVAVLALGRLIAFV